MFYVVMLFHYYKLKSLMTLHYL